MFSFEYCEIEIIEGNPLYFPHGNENGDFYERLFIAKCNGRLAHGRTPSEAKNNLILLFNARG